MPLSFKNRPLRKQKLSDLALSDSRPACFGEKLASAVSDNDLSLIKELLQAGGRASDTVPNRREYTVLMEACTLGHYKCVEILARQCEKSALDAHDPNGTTACMLAAEKGYIHCLKFLIKQGANPDIVDYKGRSAIMLAATWGKLECLRLLLELGCDFKRKDHVGRTAVMYAACGGQFDCLKLLLSSASFEDERNGGESANTGTDESSLVRSEGGSRKPPAKSFIDCVDDSRSSALLQALQLDEMECAELLLEYRADVNCVNNKGKTALRLCFDHFVLPLARRVLEAGANPSRSPKDQQLLHEAIAREENVIVRYMVLNGCAPTLRECTNVYFDFPNVGRAISPLCVALLSGNSALASYFVASRFLTRFDVTGLLNHPHIFKILTEKDYKESLYLLQKMRSQPMTLYTLSFLAVSDVVGFGADRAQNISQSELSRTCQRELLFQGQGSRLCVSQWRDLLLEHNSPLEECLCEDCHGTRGLRFSE